MLIRDNIFVYVFVLYCIVYGTRSTCVLCVERAIRTSVRNTFQKPWRLFLDRLERKSRSLCRKIN